MNKLFAIFFYGILNFNEYAKCFRCDFPDSVLNLKLGHCPKFKFLHCLSSSICYKEGGFHELLLRLLTAHIQRLRSAYITAYTMKSLGILKIYI